MKYAVISGEYAHYREISRFGLTPLPTMPNPLLPTALASHADLNCIKLGGDVFVVDGQSELCERLRALGLSPMVIGGVGECYPNDVKLNAAVCGKTMIANRRTIAPPIPEAAERGGYTVIQVNQGYSGCSTLFVSERAVITSDDGIAAALSGRADVLKIAAGHISLRGYDYGFIGGSAKLIDPTTMLFFGDIAAHPDYRRIVGFLQKYGVGFYCLRGELCDIGGMILL